MGFGTERFFWNLKSEVMNTKGDGLMYYVLVREVKKIAYPIIKNKIPYEYVDDVYQEVLFSVWRNISSFVNHMEKKTEGQRVAWLTTIIKRRIADFYTKFNREQNEKIYIEDIACELLDREQIYAGEKDEFTFHMYEVLFHLFSISTSPEKIISFVYSKIIFSDGGCSGKPSITSEYLQGYKMFDIFERMKRDLEMYLEVQIPQSVYNPLQEKLNKVKDGEKLGEKRYQLKVKTIIDGTNRIQKKMETKKCG